MSTHHAAVWIDHSEARIFQIAKDAFDETVLHAEKPHRHVQRKTGPGAISGRRDESDNHAFYHEVALALADSQEILVLGPSTAKLELIKHVHKHHAGMEAKIVGVETVDHPTDRQVVAYARDYFQAKSGMKK